MTPPAGGRVEVLKVNCRRVSNLLSAYLDAELTGQEMLEVRAHIDQCPSCRAEHQTLRDTKRLLSSLALRTPRAEFEDLLRAEVARTASPLTWLLPAWLSAWREGGLAVPRRRPLTTVAALSLAGLLMATATLDAPVDRPIQAAIPEVYPRSQGPQFLYATPLPPPSPAPFLRNVTVRDARNTGSPFVLSHVNYNYSSFSR